MTFRLIICIDLDHESLENAYEELYLKMKTADLDWESSDEWYDADGKQGNPKEFQTARMEVFRKLNIGEI